HAHGDKEQHREGVLERQRIRGGAPAQLRFAEHDACKECAERERNVEDRRRSVGDPERGRENGEREQLARSRAGYLNQQPRHDARPYEKSQRSKDQDLSENECQCQGQVTCADRCSTATTGSMTSTRTMARSSTMSHPIAMWP